MRKGQIVSFDFLVSIILILLAIGIVFQLSENNFYSQNQENKFNEIKQVALRASDLIVSNPEIICEGYDSHCINAEENFDYNPIEETYHLKPEKKYLLGLTNEYGFDVVFSFSKNPSLNVPNNVDFFSVKRKIIINPWNTKIDVFIGAWKT